MSTEAGSAPARNTWLRRAHRLFDLPAIFDLYQIVADGGKRSPVSRFLSGIDYQTVLDLGCGTGAWSYLARGPYLGIDFSESFIRGCRRRYGNESNKTFQVGDLGSVEIERRFDLVLMMSVLHHLSDNEASGLLRQLEDRAGRLLVMDLMPNPPNPLSRILYRLDRGDHIRSAEDQRRILLQSGGWALERSDNFYSYNRLYRHTLFLLRSRVETTDDDLQTEDGA
jgi:SAM-dependent methyltransferase